MSQRSVVFAVLLYGIVSHATSTGERLARITGQTEAKIEDYPWVASIRKEGQHTCAGSIINPKTIVTVAHCVDQTDFQMVDVRVGSRYRLSGGETYTAEAIIRHPRFKQNVPDYDIALIRLIAPIIFSNTIKVVPLVKAAYEIPIGSYGYVVGWGRTDPKVYEHADALQVQRVKIVSEKQCGPVLMSKRMMCAGDLELGTTTCAGDSGGPLTVDGVLVGMNALGRRCGQPDVYTRISAFRPWIDDHLKKLSEELE